MNNRRILEVAGTVIYLASMTKSPKKNTGEIGSTRITQTADGPSAEIIPSTLPSDKEGLERFFAERFVEQFNVGRPLGPQITIADIVQNDTSDLDYSIKSPVADYLELAELNPRSETFGRAAYRTGKINVYEYARWIFFRLVKKKAHSYGATSRRTILLLYVTHWQFYPSERVIECLNSLVHHNDCDFAAVFAMLTNGSDLRVLKQVHPYLGPALPAPSKYSGFTLTNLEPGHSSWSIGL